MLDLAPASAVSEVRTDDGKWHFISLSMKYKRVIVSLDEFIVIDQETDGYPAPNPSDISIWSRICNNELGSILRLKGMIDDIRIQNIFQVPSTSGTRRL
jgi:hypothetical protein